jgi:hypothetical protein
MLADEFHGIKLSPELHWVKLVVLIMDGRLKTLVVTVDGAVNDRLGRRLAAYNWPVLKDFSMAKLFFVIGGT